MTLEEKSLVDLSLIRGDILEFMSKINEVRQPIIQEYLIQNPTDSIDLGDLMRRVRAGNRQYLLERKEPKEELSYEEMLFTARMERHCFELVGERIPELQVPKDAIFESIVVDSVPAEWQRTPSVSEESVILFLHGGAFMSYSPKTHRRLSVDIGRVASAKVLSVDYRLTPEHPYPAALDDVFSIYNWLIDEGINSSNIIVAGDSAGGYLTLMTLLKLRDEKKPLPAAGVCMSPVTDLTASHNDVFENIKTDIVLAPMGLYWILKSFLGEADPSDGAVSPLFADLEGLPPLLFQVSKIEMLYSDSTRFVDKARTAGVDVTLQVWNDTVHDFQWFNLPEAKDALEKIGVFVKDKIG